MFQNELAELQHSVDTRDLAALDDFLFPRKRECDTRQDFHAPLMLSAHNVRHLSKIPRLQTDCVMLNLEDGVSPELKPFALRLAALALSRLPRCDKKIVVRVNALDEGGAEEIAILNAFMPDAVRIPKIRNVTDVEKALKLVAEPIEVHLSVETAEAWLQLSQLRPDTRVKVFYLGILDLFADMGLAQSLIAPDNPTVHYMLAHFLSTARALGVKPVSFVYQDFGNLDVFAQWLTLEKQMGFDAKGCISPAQAAAAMSAFAADTAALERARDIVAAFEAASRNGVTGVVHERYGFIDEPVYKGAMALLKKDSNDA